MNSINVQLADTVVNAKLAKDNEIRVSLRQSGLTFASGSIRWKAKTATAFTVRIVTASGEATRTVALPANGWSNESFADQDSEIFISPKANISEFQLTNAISGYTTIDWTTFMYSSITKLITYKSPIDVSILPRLTFLTEWSSVYNGSVVDFDNFTSLSLLTRLILTYSNVIGDTKKVGLLSSLKEINLGGITDLNCKLSDFVQCTGLQTLVCSDSLGVSGTIEDLIPLSGNLTSLQLNGLFNVSGTLKSLLMLPLVTNCSLDYTGVSGKVTDLNGMKPNGGTLTLRVSDYMTNDFNSVAFVNNNTYTITFNNSGNVSNVS